MFLRLQPRKGITMFDSVRYLKRAGRSEGRSRKPRQHRSPHHRRLLCEALEARTLLSVGLAGGLQAATAAQQQTLADLPVAAQHAVSSAIGQDQSAYHAASAAAGVSLANPANGFTAQCSRGPCRSPPGRTPGTCRSRGWAMAGRCSRWGPRRPRPTATGWTATMGRSTSGTSTARADWSRALPWRRRRSPRPAAR